MSITYRPHDIDLNSVILVNHRGNVTDLRNMLLEFNVYEDLYDAGMKCDVVMSDSLGLIERMPIVGDEILVISFKTPTFDSTRSLAFSIYSIQERKKHKDRSYSYVLHGFSQEILNDLRRVEERSFNQQISGVVETIYESKLRPKETEFSFISNRTNRIEVEETEGRQSFISPKNTSPMEFIRYLQKQAQSRTYRASDYMFFQNTRGWHFRTIASLMDSERFDSFYFTQSDQEPETDNTNLASPGPDEPIRQYQKIAFVNYDTQFNLIDAYGSGLYHNKTELLDPLRKRYEEREWRYERDFDRIQHLSDRKFYTDDSPHSSVENSGTTNFFVSEIGEGYRNLPYLSNARGNDVRVSNPLPLKKFARFMRAEMAQMNNIVLDVGIPGNSDVKTGDVVRVHLQQGSIEREYIDRDNLLFGQRNPAFLVTAVRHTFNRERNQYTTILQCAKDSYGIRPRQQDD